jgi:hypothetical protein
MKVMLSALMLIVAVCFACKAEKINAVELPFSISPEYTVTRTSRESIPSPIPIAKPTTQLSVEITKDAKKASILYWDGHPARDLGPMVEKDSWSVTFLGKDATIAQTSVFMGHRNEVLVLHSKLDNTWVMIYSEDMTKEEFNEMLTKLRKK